MVTPFFHWSRPSRVVYGADRGTDFAPLVERNTRFSGRFAETQRYQAWLEAVTAS
jgi:hypothetical protein